MRNPRAVDYTDSKERTSWLIVDGDTHQYLTPEGDWLEIGDPYWAERHPGRVSWFDEHGANLFIVGYEQAKFDVQQALSS